MKDLSEIKNVNISLLYISQKNSGKWCTWTLAGHLCMSYYTLKKNRQKREVQI